MIPVILDIYRKPSKLRATKRPSNKPTAPADRPPTSLQPYRDSILAEFRSPKGFLSNDNKLVLIRANDPVRLKSSQSPRPSPMGEEIHHNRPMTNMSPRLPPNQRYETATPRKKEARATSSDPHQRGSPR